MLVPWKPTHFTIIMIIVVHVQWCRHLINKHGLFCLSFFSKCISKLPLVAGYYKLKQECTSHLSLMSKQTTQPVHSLKIVNHKTGLHQEYFPLGGIDNSWRKFWRDFFTFRMILGFKMFSNILANWFYARIFFFILWSSHSFEDNLKRLLEVSQGRLHRSLTMNAGLGYLTRHKRGTSAFLPCLLGEVGRK